MTQMTGLDVVNDSILSIACFITDAQLNIFDNEGFETVIHHPQSRLDEMGDWCRATHGSSGLTQRVLFSKITPESASDQLLAYIKRYVPKSRRGLLAGNSVHADKEFLRKPPFTIVLEHLHYRILDVSTIKEAARRWAPKHVLEGALRKQGLHDAKTDILESIEEARYYRDVLFKPLHG